MIVIAVDPGYTTGVACGTVIRPREFTISWAKEVKWEDRFTLLDIIRDTKPDLVVVEDFRLYRHAVQNQVNSPFPSVRVIGIVDLVCHLTEVPIKMQPAANRTSITIPPDHQAVVGSSPHCKDAYRHLRYFALLYKGK